MDANDGYSVDAGLICTQCYMPGMFCIIIPIMLGIPDTPGFGDPHLKHEIFEANTLAPQLAQVQSPGRTSPPIPSAAGGGGASPVGRGAPHLKHAILEAKQLQRQEGHDQSPGRTS